MPPAPDLQPAFRFLTQLRKHNNREWFEAHRAEYADAKNRFETLVDLIIAGRRGKRPS